MAGKRQNLPIRDVDFHSTLAVVKQVDVTLTAAVVKALNATPATVVAAPGSGRVLQFLGARVSLDYGSAAYTNLHNATFDCGGVAGTLTASGFFDATADKVALVAPAASPLMTPNTALTFTVLTGELATGDSPLKIRVYYRVVPTAL